MPSMTTPWKHPQTGVYYFRRGVPIDIRDILGRGREIKRSLGTKNPNEAKRLIVPYIAETDDLFSLARVRLSKDNALRLTAKDAAVLASRWYERMKIKIDEKGGRVGLVSELKGSQGIDFTCISDLLTVSGSEIHAVPEDGIRRLAGQLGVFIDEQLNLEILTVPRNSEEYLWLVKEFYVYLHELETLSKARILNNWTYVAPESIAKQSLSVEGETKKAAPVDPNAVLLSTLWKEYRESEEVKRGDNLSRLKTLDGYEANFKRLISIIGDVPVDTVKAKTIMTFRDVLLQLPKLKSKEIRAMGYKEQIAYAKANKLPLVSPTTVRNALKNIATVIEYAIECEYIESNPVERVRKPQAPQIIDAFDKERGYSREELDKIFSHNLFKNPVAEHKRGWSMYWVALISRYTGARSAEITQLKVSDIIDRGQIKCFSIRRGDLQSVKSDSSIRHIPIHQHLIDLGFLDFYKDCKTIQLFPEFGVNQYGSRSSSFGRDWGKIVRSTGVEPKAPAHEFRHTIKGEFRSLGVSDSVNHRITGHGGGNVGDNYGGAEYKMRKETLDRVYRLKLERIYNVNNKET